MNDKIYEFATRAGLITFESIHDSMAVTPSIESVAKARKFAELIVAECVKAVKPDTEYPMESVDIVEEFHRGYWVGCNDSTMRIKEHFGVEE